MYSPGYCSIKLISNIFKPFMLSYRERCKLLIANIILFTVLWLLYITLFFARQGAVYGAYAYSGQSICEVQVRHNAGLGNGIECVSLKGKKHWSGIFLRSLLRKCLIITSRISKLGVIIQNSDLQIDMS